MQASLPAVVPQHVAIIMDGNRRWAAKRSLPRALGHASGARRVRQIVEACAERGVRYLTLDEALEWFSARDRRFGASSAGLAR